MRVSTGDDIFLFDLTLQIVDPLGRPFTAIDLDSLKVRQKSSLRRMF